MSFIARVFNFFMAGIVAAAGLLFTGQPPKSGMPAPQPGAHTRYANPFVGTGALPWASGMTNPGATAPFGRVQLCPDTCFPFGLNNDRVGTGGYWYGKTHAYGFSHTRVSGAGLVEGGNFRVTPALGDADPLRRMQKPLLFSHDKETVIPGYYAVWLPEAACLAELTATVHTGVHRYTFSSSRDAHLFLDATSMLNDGGRAESGRIERIDERTLDGDLNGRIFFRAQFDAPFTARFWADGSFPDADNAVGASGSDVGADLNFGGCKDKPITMWLGVSYISQEGARANLAAESADKPFDEVYAATLSSWEERLSSIEIETGDEEIKKIFYTALYHCMIHPTDMTDVTGEYLGFGGTIGTARGYTYRSDLSLWDTFRTTHPLYCLIAPDIQRDSAQSLLRMAENYGSFPRWPKGGGEGGSMFGNPANMVMAESYLKGLLSEEDARAALTFMKNTALRTVPEGLPNRGRDFGDEYNALGYVPSETGRISVSRTLEYAWSDYAAANLAAALGPGYADDAALFAEMSMRFKNLFDPETKYFRAKNAAGEWQGFSPWMTSYYDEMLPVKYADAYSEGSARQYRWHAVQDPQWLVEQLGGREAFVKELENFMQDATPRRAALDPGSGWWVGNQHDYHAPYMFSEAGRPDLTQKWVRWTLTDRFADSPDGLDGNDDLGALSAWYILSALGFYPVAGAGRYWLGSPIVDKAVLRLGGGKELTILAKNQGAANIYVRSATLNGAPLKGATFTHEQIKDGGTLEFVMADRP